MIIDVHAHVFAFPLLRNRNSDMPFLCPEQQLEIMDAKGIDKSVILPLTNAENCAEPQSFGEILYICRKYPGRFIPFCNIDPRLPKRPDMVKVEDYIYILSQYKDLGAKGLGEFVARLYWNDPLVLKLLQACEQLQLPVLFHTITSDVNSYGVIDYPGLPLLEDVLKRFPQLIMIGHSAAFWSEISGELTYKDKNDYPTGTVKHGGAVIELMRKYPNLYGDISAGSGLNALQRDPEFAWQFLEEFQDRLLLGLDYCSIKNDMQHIEWLSAARENHNLNDATYHKIMGKNACKLLQL